eukprot:TRINITY_DN4621_c0_g1_i4.p1 TRINITY_DN4621_c0_g1~~TRINITY_DN4621_c0_g1_i4.p1  ORF type:complete len:825 (+),score=152.41 TRINITY_DN4621_c0_g1_i4:18-2492(+)
MEKASPADYEYLGLTLLRNHILGSLQCDHRFGLVAMFRDIVSQQDFLVKIVKNTSQCLPEVFEMVKSQTLNLKHPNLLQLLVPPITFLPGTVGVEGHVVFFEIFDYDLLSLMNQKMILGTLFAEEQLFKILLNCASALAHLHSMGQVHEFVVPESILIVRHVAKLAPHFLLEETAVRYRDLRRMLYLPPNHGISRLRDEVFALGMCLLHASLLQGFIPCSDLIGFNQNALAWNLSRVSTLYSNYFTDLLSKMLNLDPNLRPDPAELLIMGKNSWQAFQSSRAQLSHAYSNPANSFCSSQTPSLYNSCMPCIPQAPTLSYFPLMPDSLLVIAGLPVDPFQQRVPMLPLLTGFEFLTPMFKPDGVLLSTERHNYFGFPRDRLNPSIPLSGSLTGSSTSEYRRVIPQGNQSKIDLYASTHLAREKLQQVQAQAQAQEMIKNYMKIQDDEESAPVSGELEKSRATKKWNFENPKMVTSQLYIPFSGPTSSENSPGTILNRLTGLAPQAEQTEIQSGLTKKSNNLSTSAHGENRKDDNEDHLLVKLYQEGLQKNFMVESNNFTDPGAIAGLSSGSEENRQEAMRLLKRKNIPFPGDIIYSSIKDRTRILAPHNRMDFFDLENPEEEEKLYSDKPHAVLNLQLSTVDEEGIKLMSNANPSRNSTVSKDFSREVYPNGSLYEGETNAEGLRHGQGTFYYLSGGRYTGSWSNGKIEGIGTLFYPSGAIAYEGEWRNGKFNGTGILYNETPSSIKIESYENLEMAVSDGWISYKGEFCDDTRDGFGEVQFSDGSCFRGHFTGDKINGRGVLILSDGRRIEGEWSNNVEVGKRR